VRVRCPNPECGKLFSLKDEFRGKKVKCPGCGTAIPVPAAPGPQATVGEPAVSGPQATAPEPELKWDLPKHHPARLVCTNCGAVLGVRDKICPQCGGDVRSGVTVMISREEREKAGLFANLPWMKKRGKKGGGGGWSVLVGLVVLIAIVAAVIIFVLR
ncbi:MAG: hypothetical protein KAX44_09385, partial [Candidatus Brocadiae bacterium]|nr:hypothetical protein [Candidatus Brocadiia bacterium]